MHRMSQAQLARALAAICGHQHVADLLEMHAYLCEQTAARMALKGLRPKRKPAGIPPKHPVKAWVEGPFRCAQLTRAE